MTSSTYVESEFYVIKLVYSDEEARSTATQRLGLPSAMAREQLVSELIERNTAFNLARRFGCALDQIFVELAHRLDDAAGLSSRTSHLTDSDSYWLVLNRSARDIIAGFLGCHPQEALQFLFPPEPLAVLLMDAGVLTQDKLVLDTQRLLIEFWYDRPRTLLARHLGFDDRWAVLQEDLLSDKARQKLAQTLRCPEDQVLSYLIAYIKAFQEPTTSGRPSSRFGAGEGLDFIGLSGVRSQVDRFQFGLLEQARQQADFARARLPACRVPTLLPTLIRFYMTHEFRIALEELLGTKQPLRQMLLDYDKQSIVVTQISPKARLEITATADGEDADSTYTAVIRCAGEAPIEILRLYGLARDQLAHIQKHLPTTADALSAVGSSLPDRLLNTFFPLFGLWRQQLRKALGRPADPEAIDDAFVQCFVLAGARLNPTAIPELRIKDKLAGESHLSATVEFPTSAQEIAAALRDDYARQRRTVRPVTL